MLYGEAAGEPTVGLQVGGQGFVKEDAQTDVSITAGTNSVGDTLSQVVITAPAGWVLNAVAGGQIASVAGDGTTTLTLTLTPGRSEEHTSELQSLMRISYAGFCLKKKNNTK